ncbi:hypothetical protein ACS8Y6_05405 [Salinisphaera sp. RV14]|uniref:hypothetical protein n=1 Tax=Salinisphaera sp. RV14 TaxID=3454140 RepID=UPI003F860479
MSPTTGKVRPGCAKSAAKPHEKRFVGRTSHIDDAKTQRMVRDFDFIVRISTSC